MKIWSVAGIILVGITLGSCKDYWDSGDKELLRTACMGEAHKWAGTDQKAKDYCDCVVEKIVAKYPHENDALDHLDSLIKDTSVQACKVGILGK